MPEQNLIYSTAIANAAGDGPWVDVGGFPNGWTIHIVGPGSFTVEVSNEIPTPYSYTSQNPNISIPSYPPYGPPATVTNYNLESHAIAATVTVTHAPPAGSSFANRGVQFDAGPQAGASLMFSPGGPASPGTYSVSTSGVYSFNATDVANGFAILLSYTVTTPNAGLVLGSPYILTSTGHALIIAKSDLNVKWVRVRQGTPGSTLAFLHVGK
jgi:hypothetical protein